MIISVSNLALTFDLMMHRLVNDNFFLVKFLVTLLFIRLDDVIPDYLTMMWQKFSHTHALTLVHKHTHIKSF